jgi:hypothetical protein
MYTRMSVNRADLRCGRVMIAAGRFNHERYHAQ